MTTHNIGDKVIFLDFDGVTHPILSTTKTYFSNLSPLEVWLRDNQDVQIVISSSWRQAYPLQKLQSFFSSDIMDRIIDFTPINVPCPQNKFWRQAEIEAWLKKTQYQGHWAALDDAKTEFEDGHPNLICCQPRVGVTEREIKKLGEFFFDF